MKGFAIFVAILGFCLQYVNAAVARYITPVPRVEVLADPSPVKRVETLVFNENENAQVTQGKKQDELSISSYIIPREKAAAAPNPLDYPWQGRMLHFVQCVYLSHPEPGFMGSEAVLVDLVLKAFEYCTGFLGWFFFELAKYKETYIIFYGPDQFPPTSNG